VVRLCGLARDRIAEWLAADLCCMAAAFHCAIVYTNETLTAGRWFTRNALCPSAARWASVCIWQRPCSGIALCVSRRRHAGAACVHSPQLAGRVSDQLELHITVNFCSIAWSSPLPLCPTGDRTSRL